MPPKCKFTEGEKVLCFHGPLIYEAKCLKYQITKDKQVKYFIHYAGWNKNWDEWVPENRVLKYNDANVQKQKEVQKTHLQSTSQKKKSNASNKVTTRKSEAGREKGDKDNDSRASTPIALDKPTTRPKYHASTPTQDSEPPRKKRGGRGDQTDTDEYHAKVEIKITLPEDLKLILLDENELILKQKKLCSLPARITVDKILDDYVKTKEEADKESREGAQELTKGIKEYFNVTLGLRLLYKWERPQYEDIMSNDSEALPSQIYGAFHLLRLFVKIGGMLSFEPLDELSIQVIVNRFQDFLQYLHKNSASLFDLQQDYVVSTPDYLRKFLQL